MCTCATHVLDTSRSPVGSLFAEATSGDGYRRFTFRFTAATDNTISFATACLCSALIKHNKRQLSLTASSRVRILRTPVIHITRLGMLDSSGYGDRLPILPETNLPQFALAARYRAIHPKTFLVRFCILVRFRLQTQCVNTAPVKHFGTYLSPSGFATYCCQLSLNRWTSALS